MDNRTKLNEQLVVAVNNNDSESVARLIANGASVNTRESDSRSAGSVLRLAAEKGFANIVKILLDAGANISAYLSDEHYTHPLFFAIAGGHTEVVRVMFSSKFYKADPNVDFAYSETALKKAASLGQLEILKILLAAGAKVDAGYSPSRGYSALSSASEFIECVKVLIAAGADVNSHEVGGSRPLHKAALSGCLATVQLLVVSGADILAEDNFHETAAHVAAKDGYQEIVKYLRSAFEAQEKAKQEAAVREQTIVNFSKSPTAMFKSIKNQTANSAEYIKPERRLSL